MPRISNPEQMLTTALNDLVRDWEITVGDWQDQARTQFENEIVDPVVRDGRAAVRAMTEISQLLRRVVRECR